MKEKEEYFDLSLKIICDELGVRWYNV